MSASPIDSSSTLLNAVVLAAGKGTRMKSALPKVLHPIAGRPMVQHILDTLVSVGVNKTNLIYGHGAEQLKSTLGNNDLNWCLQAEQLGTGHAVMQAVPNINDDENVLILVGDAPLIKAQTLQNLITTKNDSDLVLLTVVVEDPTGMGRIVRDGEQVKAIVEHKDATEAQREINEINTGIMIMGGADLKRWLGNLNSDNAQQEYYLTDVIEMAANEGKVIKAVQATSETEVEGINNRVQLAKIECAYQHEMAENLMLNGVSLADPYRIDVRGELITGQDVNIDVNVVFEGKVTIGNDVRIGANCILKDCEVADGATIEPFSMLEQAKVGENCSVGPYARLRPGSVMKAQSRVGNFVEMKKTELGEGSKANHLTYLGDTTVGSGANIGAGTITCNYDGVNKSKTLIGDGAFIGSNSALVAPVSIGNQATVGAGSVVNKNVEDQQLAVCRAKQRNIDGWSRPVKK